MAVGSVTSLRVSSSAAVHLLEAGGLHAGSRPPVSGHLPVDRPAWVPWAAGAVESRHPHTPETCRSALKAALCPTARSLPAVHGPAGEACSLGAPPSPTSVLLGGRTSCPRPSAGYRTVPRTQPGSSRGGRGGAGAGSTCFWSVSPRLLLGRVRVDERTDRPLRSCSLRARRAACRRRPPGVSPLPPRPGGELAGGTLLCLFLKSFGGVGSMTRGVSVTRGSEREACDQRPRRKTSIFVFSQQKGHFRDPRPRVGPRGACARGLLEVRLPAEAGPRGRSAARCGAWGSSGPGDSLRFAAEGARGVTAAQQGPGSEAPALTAHPLPNARFRVLSPGPPPEPV